MPATAHLYYHAPIVVTRAGTLGWWFSHPHWQPGDWIRASLVPDQHAFRPEEGCRFWSFTVHIVEEWTQTETSTLCTAVARLRHVKVLHWVRFHVPPASDYPFRILPRFTIIK